MSFTDIKATVLTEGFKSDVRKNFGQQHKLVGNHYQSRT